MCLGKQIGIVELKKLLPFLFVNYEVGSRIISNFERKLTTIVTTGGAFAIQMGELFFFQAPRLYLPDQKTGVRENHERC